MGDSIRVTVVATGLGKAKKHVQLVPQQMLRTGTHNSPMMPSAGMGGAAASQGLSMGAAGGMGGGAAPAFDGMKAPAVWRRGRLRHTSGSTQGKSRTLVRLFLYL